MTSPDSRAVVFDLGGTNLRSALYEGADGSLETVRRSPSPNFHRYAGCSADELVQHLLDALREEAARVAGRSDYDAVGVAFPGPVRSDGYALGAPTLWGQVVARPVDLRARLESLWPGKRVTLVNDVTAAGYRYAPANGVFCIFTVGSGIGHKVFIDGVESVGPNARGGEFGHWTFDRSPDAARCECGGTGHLGAVASGRAAAYQVARKARDASELWRTSPVARASEEDLHATLASSFRDGDPFAVEVVESMARALASALVAVQLCVGAESFVLVGGWADALGERYIEAVRAAANELAWPPAEWASMVRAGTGDGLCGLVGMGCKLFGRT